MTADRDLNRQLAGWLDERATTAVPEDLLARSLARVGATRQRPGWLVGDRLPVDYAALGRAMVPAWALVFLLILAALAVVATGARLLLLPVPATIVDASPAPSPRADESVAPTLPTGPLGGGLILAHEFESVSDHGPHDVWAIDPSTGDRTLLAMLPGEHLTGSANPYSFQQSADGRRVLAVGGFGARELSVTDAGRVRGFMTAGDLKSKDQMEGLILSPTGNRVAYVRADGFDTPIEIVILDVSSGTVQRLPLPSGMLWFGLLSWAPDASAVLAYGCQPCNKATDPTQTQTPYRGHLYIVPLDGGPWRELLDADNGGVSGAWSPDGTTLVTGTWICAKGSFMPRCDFAESKGSLGTVKVADGAATDLGEVPGLFAMSYSPDGQRIAYQATDGIYVRSATGGAPLKVVDGASFGPDWSPDGQWLLFERASFEIWIVPAVGGEPRRIGTGLAGATW
jgi:Tol biopolymer transport system component